MTFNLAKPPGGARDALSRCDRVNAVLAYEPTFHTTASPPHILLLTLSFATHNVVLSHNTPAVLVTSPIEAPCCSIWLLFERTAEFSPSLNKVNFNVARLTVYRTAWSEVSTLIFPCCIIQCAHFLTLLSHFPGLQLVVVCEPLVIFSWSSHL